MPRYQSLSLRITGFWVLTRKTKTCRVRRKRKLTTVNIFQSRINWQADFQLIRSKIKIRVVRCKGRVHIARRTAVGLWSVIWGNSERLHVTSAKQHRHASVDVINIYDVYSHYSHTHLLSSTYPSVPKIEAYELGRKWNSVNNERFSRWEGQRTWLRGLLRVPRVRGCFFLFSSRWMLSFAANCFQFSALWVIKTLPY